MGAQAEPWLRGTHTESSATQRAVVHALELAQEDLQKWCGELNDAQLNDTRGNLAPVAFHLRHIAGSMDRLLSYAEGKQLSAEQMETLKTENAPGARRDEVFAQLNAALEKAIARVKAFPVAELEQSRTVGKKQLPTSVAGLLVHVADHTQRHVGQAITTAKLVSQ
ncbi:MAG TPA: DinB family protein [Candidatus Koribacter sp.]|jgi:uncharacterized damage-inducible protein DinB